MTDTVTVKVLREHLKDDQTLAYEGETYTVAASLAREMPTLVKIVGEKAEPAPQNKMEAAPSNKAAVPVKATKAPAKIVPAN